MNYSCFTYRIIYSVIAVLLCICYQPVTAQIVGSQNPGESLPKEVKPADISGNAYQGDVDLFTGAYSASYPIGKVSTPGGLSYGLNLSYSSSHMTGSTPPHLEGVPYGTGWNLNIPTITVTYEFKAPYETETYRDYVAEGNTPWGATDFDEQLPYSSTDGELYWHSPTVNIPGVYNGRMVLKYLEGNQQKPLFVPVQFDRYFELRLNGNHWEVQLDDGTIYEFGLAKKGYRESLNKRVLGYNNSDLANGIDQDDYSMVEKNILSNTHLPKQEYLEWYCTRIRSKNTAWFQGIRFDYEKFGKVNYYRVFDEDFDNVLAPKVVEKFFSYAYQNPPLLNSAGDIMYDENGVMLIDTTSLGYIYTFNLTDFDTYSDIFLKQIVSYDYFSDIEKVKLNYKTKAFAQEDNILRQGKQDVHATDSLYSYKSVYYQGKHDAATTPIPTADRNFYQYSGGPQFYPVNDTKTEFTGWHRYLHRMHTDVQNSVNYTHIPVLQSTGQNPYLSIREGANTSKGYLRMSLPSATNNRLEFNHGFLESDPIAINGDIVPGDRYEIRTLVGGVSSEGTIDKGMFLFDINIKAESDEAPTLSWAGNQDFEFIEESEAAMSKRNIPVFSTFNNGIKWATYETPTNAATKYRATSNFFTMPYVAGFYDLKIQVGPANSDHDHTEIDATSTSSDLYYKLPKIGGTSDIDTNMLAYNLYASRRHRITGNSTSIRPSTDVPYHFGIGLPWYQTRLIYQDILGAGQLNKMYGFWWNTTHGVIKNANYKWPNEPTLGGDGVALEAVELIRHGKNTYMLDNVETWKLNGESNGVTDPGWTIVNKLQFEHDNLLNTTVARFIESEINDVVDCNGQQVSQMTFNYPSLHQLVSSSEAPVSRQYINNVVILKGIRQLPIRPWDNVDSLTTAQIAEAPTTHFDYTNYSMHYDTNLTHLQMIKANEIGGWKNTPLLSKVTSHLGGETEIQYHEYIDEETQYLPINYQLENPLEGSYIVSSAAQITNPVKYIKVKSGDATWQQTDYAYEFPTKIQNYKATARLPFKIGHWQYGFRMDIRSGFKKVTVTQPSLNGNRPYTVNYFDNTAPGSRGTVSYCAYDKAAGTSTIGTDSITHVSTHNNIFYGNLIRTEQYDANDFLLSETSIEYAADKAFENAIKRPYNNKFNAAQTDYFDYLPQTDNVSSINFTSTIDQPFSSSTFVIGGHGQMGGSHFLNLPQFVAYGANTHDAYFVRKIKEETKQYDPNTCHYLQAAVPGVPGYINPILTDTFILGRIGDLNVDESTIRTELMQSLPHSESVLESMINRSTAYSNTLVQDILISQPDLSNATLTELIKSGNSYSDETIRQAFMSMSYAVADSIIDTLDYYLPNFDEEFKDEITGYHDLLPDRTQFVFPATLSQSFTNRAENSNESALISMIEEADEDPDGAVETLIEDSPLSDNVLEELLNSTAFEDDHLYSVLRVQPDWSDFILKKMLDKINAINANNVITLFSNAPHVISDDVLFHLLSKVEDHAETTTTQILSDHPYLSDTICNELITNINTYREEYSQNFYHTVFLSNPHFSDQNLKDMIAISDPNHRISGSVLTSIFDHQAVYPNASVLSALTNNWEAYGESNLKSMLTHPRALLSFAIVDAVKSNPFLSSLTKDDVEDGYYNGTNQYNYSCNGSVTGLGNLSMSTTTEYEYYDATVDGKTDSPGYLTLFDQDSGQVQLVFEPSWQLYSTKTYSSENPGAFTQKENYYYYDLFNRYNPNDLVVYDVTVLPSSVVFDTVYTVEHVFDTLVTLVQNGDTILVNISLDTMANMSGTILQTSLAYDTMLIHKELGYINYPQLQDDYTEFAHVNHTDYPDAENIVGARLSHEKGLRNIPYQVRTVSKNNLSADAEEQSEYFVYHADWERPEDALTKVVDFTGPSCTTPPADPDPLIEAGCEFYKYPIQAIPYGSVVYLTVQPVNINVYYVCPCGAIDTTAFDSVTAVSANPMGLLDLVQEGKCFDDLPDWNNQQLGGRPVFSEFAFKDLLAFGEHHVQLDTISDGIYNKKQLDRRGVIPKVKLLEFKETGIDEPDTTEIILPYDALKKYSVLELNRWGMPQLTANENELYTKHYYEEPYFLFYRDTNCWKNSYSAVHAGNIGVPYKVVEGATFKRKINYGTDWHIIQDAETDSLVTFFNYNNDYSIDSILDPNGMSLHYTYDDLGRMEKSYRNGDSLSLNRYSTWDNDFTDSFLARTEQNYVETSVYNNSNSLQAEQVRKWIDPMAREYHTASRISSNPVLSTNGTSVVHSGAISYDAWNRPHATKKPFVHTNSGSAVSFVPRMTSTNTSLYPDVSTYSDFEDDPRSRPLEEAPYGHQLGNTHNKTYQYDMANGLCMACDLQLSNTEANEMMPGGVTQYAFNRVITTDHDGKSTTEYTNALGQKVATKQENGNDDAVTLFLYDNWGRVNKVINPEKQNSLYDYNLMGWLYRKTTPDAGRERFMYNKSGSVQISIDENGRNATGDHLFFRFIDYDRFNRPIHQGRRYFGEDDNNLENTLTVELLKDVYETTNANPDWDDDYKTFIPSHSMGYSFLSSVWHRSVTYNGPSTALDSMRISDNLNFAHYNLEKEWYYSEIDYTEAYYSDFVQADLYPVANTLVQSANNTRGKLVATLSYNNDEITSGSQHPVEIGLYSYNEEGQPEWTLHQFRAAGITNTDRGSLTRILYPEYNLRGSLLTENVDVNVDGVIDFQYHYQYDGFNRLKEVYANVNDSEDEGNKIASYSYNDAYGLLTKTTYTRKCNSVLSEGAQGIYDIDEIVYNYDTRDRLTHIDGQFYDEYLKYDNQGLSVNGVNVVADQNYNGNINAILSSYTLGGFVNDPGTFTGSTAYGYTYDNLNRLKNADGHLAGTATSSNLDSYKYGDVNLAYDKIGNIQYLQRYTDFDNNSLTEEYWNYSYQTGNNRLMAVNGVGSTLSRSYQYDANGNLTNDSKRKLAGFNYGRANLPFELYADNQKIDYLYDVNDSRIYKDAESFDQEYYLRDFSGKEIGVFNHGSSEWTWYIHGDNRFAKYTPLSDQQPGTTVSSSVPSVNFLTHSNVRIDEMTYYVFDHLGNTRLNYTVSVDNCDVDEELQLADTLYTLNFVGDYFPFGKTLREFSSTPKEKYLTTHHERDLETGLDYRGARFYDSDIGKFLSLDPHALDYPEWSDYNYVKSNPIAYVDPDGKDARAIVTKVDEKTVNVVIQSKIFIYGSESSSLIEENLNNNAELILKKGSYTEDGVTYNISFDVQFEMVDDINSVNLQMGDNTMEFTSENLRSHVDHHSTSVTNNGGDMGYVYHLDNNAVIGSSNKNDVVVHYHELLHLFGLSDRYSDIELPNGGTQSVSHKGFGNDIMGSTKRDTKISQTHYDNWGKYVKSNFSEGTNYIINLIDRDKNGNLK